MSDRYHIDCEACPECGNPCDRFVVDYQGMWTGEDGKRRVAVTCQDCDATWAEIITKADGPFIAWWEFPPPENEVATCRH